MSAQRLLFDRRERSDPSPARYGEGMFSFLNRVDSVVSARVRDLLEDWFSRLPEVMRDDIYGRVRSGDDRQALAAFWEMYLFEAHRRLGFRIECHPEVPGQTRQPDFLMEREAEGRSFYLEATVASRWSDPAAAEEQRRRVIYDRINAALDSPNFFLEIRFEREGSDLPSDQELVGRLGNWLGTLDPDETGRILRAGDALDEAPAFTLEARDWVIGFRALPKKAEARGKSGRPLGAFPGKISAVDDRTPILSALRSKATRYGELDRPYVVALLVDRVFADEEDVEEALFGPVHYTLVEGAEDLSAKPLRHPDGLWQRGSANRNTRVSAVLAAINLAPYFVARNMPRLWHNPWARRPLTAELPWPGAAADPETGLLERGEANVPPHELFGLQAEWPGPEDPFPRGET